MSKVKIQGNASGTGTLTISAPNTNTDRSLTLPDKAGELVCGAGSVLQVVQGTYNTQVNYTSSGYTDTGLTATITPSSASNKILVLASHQGVGKYSANTFLQLKLFRDATDLNTFRSKGIGNNTTTEHWVGDYSCNYLDSPSTTSAVTYKTQVQNGSGSGTVRLQSHGAISTIILMEISA
jgi:hypothetical protein